MRTILVDSDIVAYKVASISEVDFDWDNDGDTVYATDDAKAIREAEIYMRQIADKLDADRVIVCLSDDVNWRKELWSGYKGNRTNLRKPELLQYVKKHLAAEWPSYQRPRLEADDIMGILATHLRLVPGEKIIVSEDKDLRTVPARVYNPRYPERGIQEISELDADRLHMWQTMVGDPVDGYLGCRGIGEKSEYAQEILFADRENLWDIVLEAYASKGRTEADALLQARMAHILRAPDFNFKTKKVRLWNPLFLI